MTRVVHLHLHPRRTGITRHVESVVWAEAPGFEVAAFGTSLKRGRPRWSLRQLWHAVRREPLLLHAHRNLELIFALLLRLVGLRVKVVATRHSATRPSALTRALLRRADLRIALTEEVAALMDAKAEVVGHGVDLEIFSPPEDRASAFRALGLPGRGAVGVVGRIRPEKGQGDFVEAWRGLPPELREAWVPVLVGGVRQKDRVFEDALVGSVPNLVLTGELPEVVGWLRGLSVVVQPSRSEGFSLVVLEAMACGACVVATRLPHFERGIIDHERTGFLYPAGDTAALAEILASLLAEPARIAEVGARAAEHARRTFGIQSELRHLAALYTRLSGAPE